jgi:hypothetical protein
MDSSSQILVVGTTISTLTTRDMPQNLQRPCERGWRLMANHQLAENHRNRRSQNGFESMHGSSD